MEVETCQNSKSTTNLPYPDVFLKEAGEFPVSWSHNCTWMQVIPSIPRDIFIHLEPFDVAKIHVNVLNTK